MHLQVGSSGRKAKEEIGDALHNVELIIKQIKEGAAEWDWANRDKHCGNLAAYCNNARTRASPFVMRFITEDPLKLRRTLTREALTHELDAFAKIQGSIVTPMINFLVDVQLRHQATLKALKVATAKKAERV